MIENNCRLKTSHELCSFEHMQTADQINQSKNGKTLK